MKYITFKPEFAGLVERGEKLQTIRPTRARPFIVGEDVSLRQWSGKAYRSKQITLRTGKIKNVRQVVISRHPSNGQPRFWLQNVGFLNSVEINVMARLDGFCCIHAFMNFFETVHELPFRGQLIQWKPL